MGKLVNLRIMALRITVHIRSKGYGAVRLNGVCANTTTLLASPTCLKTWFGVSQSNVGLTVGSWPSWPIILKCEGEAVRGKCKCKKYLK